MTDNPATQIHLTDEIAKHIRVLINGLDMTEKTFFVDLATESIRCYFYVENRIQIDSEGWPIVHEYTARGKLVVEPRPGAPSWVGERLAELREMAEYAN